MSSPIIHVRRLDHGKDLPLPRYHSGGSAAFDLLAAVEESLQLQAGCKILIPTGIAVELPPGYEIQVRPRSGHALRYGVSVLNSPGTIDSDYRGEVGVILVHHGEEDFPITRGMRIAQAVVAPIIIATILESETLGETRRGNGGFGSTGDD